MSNLSQKRELRRLFPSCRTSVAAEVWAILAGQFPTDSGPQSILPAAVASPPTFLPSQVKQASEIAPCCRRYYLLVAALAPGAKAELIIPLKAVCKCCHRRRRAAFASHIRNCSGCSLPASAAVQFSSNDKKERGKFDPLRDARMSLVCVRSGIYPTPRQSRCRTFSSDECK